MEMIRNTLHQAGVLAYQFTGGEIRMLLVTSRDTGRWVIPRGNIDRGVSPDQAAVQEAYEEAGIKGSLATANPIGFYTYFKKLDADKSVPATVEVYPMLVRKMCNKWPEKGERRLWWTSPVIAADLVDEPGLSRLILRLMEVKEH